MKGVRIDPKIFLYDSFEEDCGNIPNYNSLMIDKEALHISDSLTALKIPCNNASLGDDLLWLDYKKLRNFFKYEKECFRLEFEKIEKKNAGDCATKVYKNKHFVFESHARIHNYKLSLEKYLEKTSFVSAQFEKDDISSLRYCERIKLKKGKIHLDFSGMNPIIKEATINKALGKKLNIKLRYALNGFNPLTDFELRFIPDFVLYLRDKAGMEYMEVIKIDHDLAREGEFFTDEEA